MKKWIKVRGRVRRHKMMREKISGIKDKPRLSVYRSIDNLYAQLVDDVAGHTLLGLSTNSPDLKDKVKKDGGNVKGASILGISLAELCKKNGISKIVFDRSGYAYHGRVKALAEALRKGGLQF
ncbi:MAG: 50S ribosomal protein L18 [Candidatus Omnitrophota bacterium]|jgi:large subunit ribosomal protein L18